MLRNTYNKHSENAFTLMEIIIVIIVVSSIVSMALPRYFSSTEKVKSSEAFQILDVLRSAQVAFKAETGGYANSASSLDATVPTSKNFDPPTVSTTDPIVSIVRKSSYTLNIFENGTITCTGGAAGLCTKLGY